jgi:CelD/BcsL family acetyltransferase involved in cellulose biosynthesis
MGWKAAQYVRTGRSNRFADKRFRGFVEELFSVRTDTTSRCDSRVSMPAIKVRPSTCLCGPTRLAGWFPAYNPDLARFSPGMACMLSLVEAAANDGLQRLDLGEGAADYKESFKNFDDHVAEGWTERPTATAVLRRAQLAPKRAAMRIVLGNPRLRLMARTALNKVGSVRAETTGSPLGLNNDCTSPSLTCWVQLRRV